MKRYDVESAKDLIFIPCHLNNAQKIERVKQLIEHYSKFGFILFMIFFISEIFIIFVYNIK